MMNTLSTECILNMLNLDQQRNLLNALQMIVKPEEKHNINNRLEQLGSKYFDLVWLARKQPQDFLNPEIKKIIDKVCAEHPGELEKLQSEDEGDWVHGFNSGMLACVRLLGPYCLPNKYKEEISDDYVISRNSEIELAEQEFPFLDT